MAETTTSETPPVSDSPTAGSAYEFTPSENKMFNSLGRHMRVLAYSLFLGGALYVIYGCYLTVELSMILDGPSVMYPALVSVASAFLTMFMGLYLVKSAGDFSQIVCTEGSDIGHLMHGLRTLDRLFTVSAYFAWPFVLFLLIAVITGLTWSTINLRF